MVYKNLNIPATLVHSVKGKEYTIKGNLTEINESTNTCTMQFGNKISNNIPLEEVYLNEAFVDTLKSVGSKVKKGAKSAWNKIVSIAKAVGNFILPVTEDGDAIYDYFNSPANIACMDLNGCIKCCPSDAVQEMYSNFGINDNGCSFDEAFEDPEANEARDANKYFGNIMKVYGSTDKTLEESIKYVQENYYGNAFKALNEANVLHAPRVEDDKGNVTDTYGREVNTKRLLSEIRTTIFEQYHAPKGIPRPLLIWGAPGIGKTAVIKQALQNLKNDGFDLEMVTVCCGGLRDDDFELPETVENMAGFKTSVSVPVSWLPVFDHSRYVEGSDELIAVDEYYNSGEYKRNLVHAGITPRNMSSNAEDKVWDYNEWIPKKDDGNLKRGGVIFFDEFSRLRSQKLTDTMMTIVGDRMYKGCEMASRWFMICAANSLFDDKQAFFSNKEFWQRWDPAKLARESHLRYVPTKEEWLNWARRPDSKGLQNVDEIICSFIELCTDDIWYNAMDIGAGPESVPGDKLQSIFKKIGDNVPLTIQEHDAFEKFIKSNSFFNKCLQTHDGRVWNQQIMSKIITWFHELLFKPTKSGYTFDDCFIETTNSLQNYKTGKYEEITAKNINQDILPKILDDIDDDTWDTWSFGREDDILKTRRELKNIRTKNRYEFFMLCFEELIKMIMGANSNPAKMWKIRNELNVMTDAAIQQIVNNGKISCAEDDVFLTPQSQYGQPLDKNAKWDWAKYAWKQSAGSVDRVIGKLLKKCMDYVSVREAEADLKELNKHFGESVTEADIREWSDKYTIKLLENDKKHIEIPVLIYDIDMDDPDQKQKVEDAVFTLKYSKVARKLANIALWLSKIAVQVRTNTPLMAASAKSASDNSNEYAINKQSFKKFKNVKGYSEYNQLNAENKTQRVFECPFDTIVQVMCQYQYGNEN